MKMTFTELAERCALQPEAALYAAPAAELLDGTELYETAWQKVLVGEYDEASAKAILSEAAPSFGMESNRLLLAACVMMTENMEAEYEKHGYPHEVFTDSLQDIPIWAKCCHDETGLWGMKQFDWLQNTLRARLWRLGRLEFERIEFEGEHYEKDGIVLNKGDIVTNVHIPEGSPLTPDIRDDAFRRAVKFFGSNVFVCESWMLWPAHNEMLSEKSNIRSFLNCFDLIESWESESTSDLWRIFGYLPDYSADKLPAETGLQRAYKTRLTVNGGKTGGGFGVRIFKG